MLEIGSVIILFVAFGICLFFVVVWIFKSEKARNIFKEKVENQKFQLKSAEQERSVLLEKLEESQDSIRELKESAELQQSESEGEEASRQGLNEMADRLRSLESENLSFKAELGEARGSLEEVYKAVHEEELVG